MNLRDITLLCRILLTLFWMSIGSGVKKPKVSNTNDFKNTLIVGTCFLMFGHLTRLSGPPFPPYKPRSPITHVEKAGQVHTCISPSYSPIQFMDFAKKNKKHKNENK